MKTNKTTLVHNSTFVVLLFILFSNVAFAQIIETTDSLNVVRTDTVKVLPADTMKAVQVVPAVAPVAAPAVVPDEVPAVTPKEAPIETPAETPKVDEEKPDDKKDKKGKKNEIVFYAGANFTKLNTSTAYESEAAAGYQLGAYYKQGRMFYWQAGARFASAKIGYKPANSPAGTDFGSFTVNDLDFPLTLGVNFTSFMNRVLSVRLFASAVPSVTLNVGDNSYGITKDQVNSFVMYGQGGLGINVAFLVIEAGYNYGFNELISSNPDSKPGQVFINLGFRF